MSSKRREVEKAAELRVLLDNEEVSANNLCILLLFNQKGEILEAGIMLVQRKEGNGVNIFLILRVATHFCQEIYTAILACFNNLYTSRLLSKYDFILTCIKFLILSYLNPMILIGFKLNFNNPTP